MHTCILQHAHFAKLDKFIEAVRFDVTLVFETKLFFYINFYAISRYNPSKRYAMAVYQLAEAIAAARAAQADGS